MSPDRQLYTMRVSPWSERARWALDHHALAYQEIEHVPMLGERRLRNLAKRDKASVPLLVVRDEVLTESWDIARYADRVGQGPALITREHEAAVAEWNSLTETVMQSLRAIVLHAMLNLGAALDDTVPRFVPRSLRSFGRPMARMGIRFVAKKYGINPDDDPAERHALLTPYLDRVRSTLASGSPFLLGTFSYADIIVATALQGISPADNRHWRVGRGTRQAWTIEKLATAYPDLIAWRDRLYDGHRRSK
jgi:glutathione S-transferase